MSRPNRKRNRNNAPLAQQRILSPQEVKEKAAIIDEKPLRELLFHPLIYKTSTHRNIDFDNMIIPFLIKETRVFFLSFMNGLGDASVYTQCYIEDPDSPSKSHEDVIVLMRECLEVQKLTGTDYYFGKLNKALEHYLYALQLFVDKDLLSKEAALDLVKELGATDQDMENAAVIVSQRMEDAKIRDAKMRAEAKVRSEAGDILMNFLLSMLQKDESDTEKEDETCEEES